MEHDSIMPFGKFKGRKMKDVPAWYLLSLRRNNMRTRSYGRMKDVMIYISDNYDELQSKRKDAPT